MEYSTIQRQTSNRDIGDVNRDITKRTRFLSSFVDGRNTISKIVLMIFRVYILIYHVDLITAVFKLHSFTSRFLAIKELNLLWLLLSVMNSSSEVSNLCDIVDKLQRTSYLQTQEKDEKEKQLIKERDKNLKQSCMLFERSMLVAFLFSAFIPIIQAMVVLLSLTFRKESEEIVLDDLPFILFSYYPENYRTLNVYISVQFSVGCFLYLYLFHYLLPVFTSVSLATTSIIYEIKLLCLRLEQLEDFIESSGRRKMLLKSYTSALVKSHNYIIQDIKSLNKGINGLVFGYVNVMTLQICMFIFCILEFDDIVTKLKYVLCILFVIILQSVCTSFGQRITNEGDELNWQLYNCPWLDTPIWFKRSLIIMMIRSLRKLELKPYGLYVLDLKCLTNIVNATYSYFNFFLNV